MRRRTGEILLLMKGGKSQKRWEVLAHPGGGSDEEYQLEMLSFVEKLCSIELSEGGCLMLYDNDGCLVKEVR